MINQVKRILFFLIVMGIILTPACAKPYNVDVAFKNVDGVTYHVTPYIHLQKDDWGHWGSWQIRGTINYGYPPTQPKRYTYQYADSGHVVPLYRDYWGFKTIITHVTTYNFNGNVDIVA